MVAILRFLLALALCTSAAFAHDMVHEGSAGPYRVTVYLNPHVVQPGVVELVARGESDDLQSITFAVSGIESKPTQTVYSQQAALRDAEDASLFRASLKLPPKAFWRVHVEAAGTLGAGEFSIPVAASAPSIGIAKSLLQTLVVAGWVLLSGCVLVLLRWVWRGPSGTPRRLLPVSAVVASPCLLLGWSDALMESVIYRPSVYQFLYTPIALHPAVDAQGSLHLELTDPGWIKFRRFDDIVLDHGHPMHLFALRLPELDHVYHLHPEMTAPGVFRKRLPQMPAGRYQMVSDIVHESGLWEAPQGEFSLPLETEGDLEGDDSGGAGPGISAARFDQTVFLLSSGHRMVWDRPAQALRANEPLHLRFRLEDSTGAPAHDVELYMGMLGHAAVIRHDREVFSHVHPTGSIAMASLETLDAARHSGHSPMVCHDAGHELAAEVAFPYAFPLAGKYRVIVQMKRGGRVETGFFDALVGD
jgi:hypothetical protein